MAAFHAQTSEITSAVRAWAGNICELQLFQQPTGSISSTRRLVWVQHAIVFACLWCISAQCSDWQTDSQEDRNKRTRIRIFTCDAWTIIVAVDRSADALASSRRASSARYNSCSIVDRHGYTGVRLQPKGAFTLRACPHNVRSAPLRSALCVNGPWRFVTPDAALRRDATRRNAFSVNILSAYSVYSITAAPCDWMLFAGATFAGGNVKGIEQSPSHRYGAWYSISFPTNRLYSLY